MLAEMAIEAWRARRSRLRGLGVAILAVSVLLSSPRVRGTAAELLALPPLAWRERHALAQALRTPGAGDAAVGPMLEAVLLLRQSGEARYSVSPAIAADDYLLQRLVEGAWPLRPAPDARLRVSLLAEAPRCPVLAERRMPGFEAGGVRIARCP